MMKKIVMVVSLLMALFLVSACAPQVSDEELEAQLDTLSDEELDKVIDESSKSKALSGQASAAERKFLPSLKGTVTRDRLLQAAQAVKIKRLEEQLASGLTDQESKGMFGDGHAPSGAVAPSAS